MQESQSQVDSIRRCEPSLLLSLPGELIENICQQLYFAPIPDPFHKYSDSRSLAFFCRTSKTLHLIGTRILYSGFCASRNVLQLARFLKTLYERPELCKNIRVLSLSGGDSWMPLRNEYIDFISKIAKRFHVVVTPPTAPNYPSTRGTHEDSEDVDACYQYQPTSPARPTKFICLEQYGEESSDNNIDNEDEDEDVLVEELEDENGDNDHDDGSEHPHDESRLREYPFETIAQLIIALSPNLQKLQVIARQTICDIGEGAFTLLEELAKQSPPPISLPHLHYFAFGHDDSRQTSFKYFEGVIALAPNIRKVQGDPCFDQPEYARNAPINIRNVTDLQFKSGHLSERGLRAIVSSCERLEIFKYHYHTIYSGLDGECVTPRELVDVMSLHKGSLRHLDIDLGGREEHQGHEYFGLCIEGHQILSLGDFSCLETFKIDGSSILFPEIGSDKYHTNVLVNMLPRSIRAIYLKDMQKEATANLLTLADSLEWFPHLSEVFLEGNGMYGPLGEFEVIFEESEIHALREKLTSRGILFLKRGPQSYRYGFSDNEETTENW